MEKKRIPQQFFSQESSKSPTFLSATIGSLTKLQIDALNYILIIETFVRFSGEIFPIQIIDFSHMALRNSLHRLIRPPLNVNSS